MPLTATGMRVVMRQLAEIDSSPIDGIRLHPTDDLSELRFDLDGPEGTPFADGRFHVALVFDDKYPEVPPKGFFRTKIFHPNVSDRGDICVNALKKDWSPQLGLRHVLLVIRCLLVEPNPESALNEEAGRLLLEDYADYERKARMLTSVHAKRGAGVPRIVHGTDSTEQVETTTPPSGTSVVAPAHSSEQTSERPARASSSSPVPGPESGPLRSLVGNAYGAHNSTKKDDIGAAGGGAGGGSNGGGSVVASDASADKAKRKAAEKKKNALRRI